jgi:hypothetical protein
MSVAEGHGRASNQRRWAQWEARRARGGHRGRRSASLPRQGRLLTFVLSVTKASPPLRLHCFVPRAVDGRGHQRSCPNGVSAGDYSLSPPGDRRRKTPRRSIGRDSLERKRGRGGKLSMTAAAHFRKNVLKRDQCDFAPVDRRDPPFDLRGPRFVNRFIGVGVETVDQRGGAFGTLRFGQAERTSQDLFRLCAHVIRSRLRMSSISNTIAP